jgi:hypothetical protein
VISGEELAAQVDFGTPRLSRIFELEDGKILVLFVAERQVGLIDLTLDPRMVDFDLTDGEQNPNVPENAPFLTEVLLPRGTLRTYPSDVPGARPEMFLSFDEIQTRVTKNPSIQLDTFQPVYLPPTASRFCEGGALPKGGSALIFDRGSSYFLKISEAIADPDSEELPRGVVSAAITPRELSDLLVATGEDEGGAPVQSARQFRMSEASFGFSCSPLVIFEEETGNLFNFDFLDPNGSRKLVVAAGSEEFLLRREPKVLSGEDAVASNAQTLLLASQNLVRESRLYFDQGQDQLLAVHFQTGNVVVVVNRADFEFRTGRPLANVTFIEALEPVDEEHEVLRAFDSESNSLLEIRLQYQALPIRDRER